MDLVENWAHLWLFPSGSVRWTFIQCDFSPDHNKVTLFLMKLTLWMYSHHGLRIASFFLQKQKSLYIWELVKTSLKLPKFLAVQYKWETKFSTAKHIGSRFWQWDSFMQKKTLSRWIFPSSGVTCWLMQLKSVYEMFGTALLGILNRGESGIVCVCSVPRWARWFTGQVRGEVLKMQASPRQSLGSKGSDTHAVSSHIMVVLRLQRFYS